MGEACEVLWAGLLCISSWEVLLSPNTEAGALSKISTVKLQYFRNTRVVGPTASRLWASGSRF